jgi:hypothetical protein
LDVQPGERWLLCSDGLNYVAGHVVERTVRETKSLRECADTLIELTLEAGSPDNVTVVMLEIAEETLDDVSTAAVDIVSTSNAAAETITATVSEDSAPSPAVGSAPANPGSTRAVMPDRDGAGTPPPSDGQAAGKEANGDDESDESGTSTDPNLGEHLSAEVLKEELASRPHELVGAAATAAETGSIPSIAGRTVARRAATVLTHKSDQTRDDYEDYRSSLRPRRWLSMAVAVVVLILLGVGLWLGYAWTQTRYYIGEYDQRVAIYNGVSQRLGPIQLSTLEAVTDIPMASLPEFSQQRVRQTVPARDLYDAQRIVKNLQETGTTSPSEACPSPSAGAAPSGTAGAASPTGTPAPSPAATPSPSVSPGQNNQNCEVVK